MPLNSTNITIQYYLPTLILYNGNMTLQNTDGYYLVKN